MPDTRAHRGPHPEDKILFSAERIPALQAACADLCWLLDRGYAIKSSLALTGDRYALTARQRVAVARSAASRAQCEARNRRNLPFVEIEGREIWIDGYNLLITIEAALGGGVLLLGSDGCLRDLASLHGTYREVSETLPAATIVGEYFAQWRSASCRWILDRPVGNSGRLRESFLALAQERGWPWRVDLESNPDAVLAQPTTIVATADSVVLDRCGPWLNAAYDIVTTRIPSAPILNLRDRV